MDNLVSVIVPIYNTEKYLENCINSILNQSYKNLEIILVDDGSTDNSGKIADEFAKKDQRIKVIHQKNAGQSAARNVGIRQANGDYISFVDSDDEINMDYVKELLAVYNNHTILSVCGMHYKRLKQQSANDVYINYLRGKKSRESFKAYVLYLFAIDGRMYSSVNKLYRTKIVKSLRFDESLNFAEDTKFVLDYLALVTENIPGGVIKFVLEPLYIYNSGTETSTMKTVATDWANWQNSYKNFKEWLGPKPTKFEDFWLRMVYLRWRISHLKQTIKNR